MKINPLKVVLFVFNLILCLSYYVGLLNVKWLQSMFNENYLVLNFKTYFKYKIE